MSNQDSISNKNNKSSENLYQEACKVIPGGVSRNTIFRRPYPFYVSHASGCYVTDIEGNKRIDFANNMASLIHGHAHPAIVSAVTEQIKKGSAYTMPVEAEIDLAKILTERITSVEKLRFVNSGTEAVMTMIRAARAFTGRSKIAKAEGAYHGTYDYAEVSQASNPSNWGDISSPNSVPLVKGTPQGVLEDVIVFPFNNVELTLAILNKYKSEIACVLIDPIPHRVGLSQGEDNFIEALFKWTRENGALLCFDEVVTFRVRYGGAQADYSILPDLTALGKIIGGGFPIGAVGGRSEVMSVLDPSKEKVVFPHMGTFSANSMSMVAGTKAMQLFDADAINSLNELTKKAQLQIKESIKIVDIPASITGAGSMFRIHPKTEKPRTYRQTYQTKEESDIITELLDYMFINENIMMVNTCSCMFSTAITQSEVDILTEALHRAFQYLKPKFDKLNKN